MWNLPASGASDSKHNRLELAHRSRRSGIYRPWWRGTAMRRAPEATLLWENSAGWLGTSFSAPASALGIHQPAFDRGEDLSPGIYRLVRLIHRRTRLYRGIYRPRIRLSRGICRQYK
jgi:hypothetical protein